MTDRVFVTGASGFVGEAVVARLQDKSMPVTAFARRFMKGADENARWIKGDLFDAAALNMGMSGCCAIIHLVGIIRENPAKGITFRRIHFEGTRAMVEAARRNGVKRFIQMSALGARSDAPAEYHRTKFMAEELLRESGLDWTIIRPSLIHGPHGEFMKMEVAWAKGTAAPFFFMPYFGRGILGRGGAGKLQPVFVDDVARAFVDAAENPGTIGQTYPLGGAEVVSWPQMHRMVSATTGAARRPAIAIPAWYATLLTRMVPAALLPFNQDQVKMSQEDNTCDMEKFKKDFGWMPRGFGETLGKSVTVGREER